MKRNFPLLASLFLLFLVGCSDNDTYVTATEPEPEPEPVYDPVSVELASVPYEKLSDYRFFVEDIKDLEPNEGVIPFRPSSELFTDYAHKKRFFWVPDGTSAAYNGDGSELNMPVGSALIKNFYYDNTAPSQQTRIIETRLMIRQESGWVFANYVWNEDQTEAFLDNNASTTAVAWTDDAGEHSINYKIPSQNQCMTCHGSDENARPLGLKPQNLNGNIAYEDGVFNQLQKLEQLGLLTGLPETVDATVDYTDASQDLTLRVRSYLDINCAHCHQTGGNAGHTNPRFAFAMTSDPAQMGVCVSSNLVPPGMTHARVFAPMEPSQSVGLYTMNSTNSFYMMPRLGRTIVHTEAVALVTEWINSLEACE